MSIGFSTIWFFIFLFLFSFYWTFLHISYVIFFQSFNLHTISCVWELIIFFFSVAFVCHMYPQDRFHTSFPSHIFRWTLCTFFSFKRKRIIFLSFSLLICLLLLLLLVLVFLTFHSVACSALIHITHTHTHTGFMWIAWIFLWLKSWIIIV